MGAAVNGIVKDEKGHFTKGFAANPTGRPALPIEVRELQDQTKIEVIKAINSSLLLTPEKLRQKLEDPAATMAQHLVGSILAKAIKEGCFARAQFLVNYVLGKPKPFETPEETSESKSVQHVLKGVPSSVLLEMVKNGRKSEPTE